MTLDIFTISLLLSILLCSLVAGLLFGFAVVVMPGIAKLSDREYLISFKHMDGIIQNNHCLLYTSPSPRDRTRSRMPSSA